MQTLDDVKSIYRTLDKTLGILEEDIRGTTSVDKFIETVEFDVLVDTGEYLICRSLAKKAGASLRMHIHPDSTEIGILVRGEGILVWEDNKKHMIAPDVVTIDANTPHGGYSLVDNTEVISILIPSDRNIMKFLELLKNGSRT